MNLLSITLEKCLKSLHCSQRPVGFIHKLVAKGTAYSVVTLEAVTAPHITQNSLCDNKA